jgi:hypothetical protein
MLREIDPGLFEAPLGSDVQLAVIAQNNKGTETARYRYGSSSLTTESVHGHDGCSFTVSAGTHQLKAGVVFDPDAPDASYELFQVNDAGVLESLNLNVTASDPTARIAFGIDGVGAELRARRAGRKTAKARPRRAGGRKKAARAAAKRTPARRVVKKKTAKKASAKKTSAKKTTSRRGKRR